ncbi:DNA-binding protein [Actinomadura sp. KC216]|uniref:DNA-binding protein n=1 Tax=Actinomadura sp. KC216 TaxID=2530370 RepID=UPI00104B4459|nr:DNA-binding protein [Actinomadura sp. KC216]TDB91018.1 DNA-binding protein [Actinomadura sp. KC216]
MPESDCQLAGECLLYELLKIAPGSICKLAGPHVHSPEEASQMLGGLSARTLRDKASRGQIAHTRPAGTNRIVFSDDGIAQIIRAGERRSTPLRRDS